MRGFQNVLFWFVLAVIIIAISLLLGINFLGGANSQARFICGLIPC